MIDIEFAKAENFLTESSNTSTSRNRKVAISLGRSSRLSITATPTVSATGRVT